MAGARVNQLDADLLDQELESLLLGQQQQHRQEYLKVVLRILVLTFSLTKTSSTYGARLENLEYIHSPSHLPLSKPQILSYTFLTVIPGWIHSRLRDEMISRGWADSPSQSRNIRRTCWKINERLDLTIQILQLLNFLRFLKTGKYRTLVERVLKVRLVPIRNDLSRNVGFEFLNRQIVWQALTDFILFLLPLIDFRALRIRANQISKFISETIRGSGRVREEPATESSRIAVPKDTTSWDRCPICISHQRASSVIQDPSDLSSRSTSNHHQTHLKIAYQTDCCQGLYCYLCVVPEILKWRDMYLDPWRCWRCGKAPLGLSRWNGVHS
ncbi:hypothetical protein PSTG_11840 [Puccinia striiformis f. sp. tritici PST-78]|uniref:RING-type E3 ubiquitin transferase (cysteine targeting) n=2 Tax=Puccinia striiformis f. sp. tritici PST-78 TaxID=1165861 RepID=A0A0L0V751_9BASI|nr:hypothetical protein PSTG_11840 [Puccinia striiformis f. sp. tritici PST-78]